MNDNNDERKQKGSEHTYERKQHMNGKKINEQENKWIKKTAKTDERIQKTYERNK